MSERRLTREEWLEAALEVVAREGGAHLRIRSLVERLGVSTGSFYWHFESRDDFVQSLVRHWADAYTSRVVERLGEARGDASQRLLWLMEFLLEHDSARYDVPMRAWAAQDAAVARLVRRVDRARLAALRALFRDMGFRGDELEVRTTTFVGFHSFDHAFLRDLSRKERRRQLRARHAFFTRP